MRDIIVSLVLLGLMPTCFRKPFVGLLVFSMLAYMRIQDLTWGFARDVRWSFMVAIITFAGFFASRRGERFMAPDFRNVIMIVMVVLSYGLVAVVAAAAQSARTTSTIQELESVYRSAAARPHGP